MTPLTTPRSSEEAPETALRREAQRLGFDLCRFTDASPPSHRSHYDHWLSLGHHGAMSYLERHREKKHDLNQVLPGVQSVICLAIAYPPPEGDSPQDPELIARYARHADYHDILAGPLESLSQFTLQLGGASTRSLAYLETGPII